MLLTDKNSLKTFYSQNRLWQGIPGIVRTSTGRLFSCFYSGGITEKMGNYSVLLQSDDDGFSWSEPILAAYIDENSRCYDASVWIDPLGRLWFIWAVMPNNAVWASI